MPGHGVLGNRGNKNPSPSTQFGKGKPSGREPGTRNRHTIGKQFALAEHLPDEQRPLAFFLAMMKGDPFPVRYAEVDTEGNVTIKETTYCPTVEDMKWGAQQAAPYLHAKLMAVEHSGNVTTKHGTFLDKLAAEDDGDADPRAIN